MYRALVSFGGLYSMRKGEIRSIPDAAAVIDLLSAKYIEEVKSNKTKAVAEKPEIKSEVDTSDEKSEEEKPRKRSTAKKKTSTK